MDAVSPIQRWQDIIRQQKLPLSLDLGLALDDGHALFAEVVRDGGVVQRREHPQACPHAGLLHDLLQLLEQVVAPQHLRHRQPAEQGRLTLWNDAFVMD